MNKTNYQVDISANTQKFRKEIGLGVAANEAFNDSFQGLNSGIVVIDGPLGGVASRVSAVNSVMTSGAVAVTAFGASLAGVVAIGVESLSVFDGYERQQLRTEALIRATGNAAGFTSQQLAAQADALALSTLGSVEGIVQAQNILQTFRSVQGDVFTEAIELSQDMAAVFGGEVKDKAVQLGKALEDPKNRLGELAEAGVNFTQSERDLVASLQDAGDMAAAQGIILDKLRGQVGGAASAEAGGLSGAVDTLGQRWDEMLNSFAKTNGTVGPVQGVLNGLSATLNSVREQIDPTVAGLEGRLAELQARASVSRGGRSARADRKNLTDEIAVVKQQLLEAKAAQGDVESINELIQQTETNIGSLREAIPNASNTRRGGRSGGQGTERGKLQKQLNFQLELQQQYQDQLQGIQEQQALHEKTQEEIKAAAAEDASKRKIEADKKAADEAAKIQARNDQLIDRQLAQYQRVYEERLKEDGKVVDLENFRYQRQLQQLEEEFALLQQKGIVTAEIEAQHQAAIENAEAAHQSRIATIRDEARQEEREAEDERKQFLIDGYDQLRGGITSFFDDIGAKESQYANIAIGLGGVLLDEKKQESISKITASTETAAMGAYEALAPIPFVGPALGAAAFVAVGAAGAASAARVAGIAHAGMGSIPREGTYLLDGGERIVAPEQNRDLTNFLSGGGSGPQIIINNNAPDTEVTAYSENNQTQIMIEQVKSSLASDVDSGNGRFTQSLERKYGLTRENKY